MDKLDIPLLVLVFPRREQFAHADLINGEKIATDWISEWLNEEHIPYLNLNDLFYANNWKKMFLDSTHPTAEAHNLIAGKVFHLITPL